MRKGKKWNIRSCHKPIVYINGLAFSLDMGGIIVICSYNGEKREISYFFAMSFKN